MYWGMGLKWNITFCLNTGGTAMEKYDNNVAPYNYYISVRNQSNAMNI